jgi:hypothetical protein
MNKQITAFVAGAVMVLSATAAFAQSNGLAIAGGAAGGPHGIYKDTLQGPKAYFAPAAIPAQKVVTQVRRQK